MKLTYDPAYNVAYIRLREPSGEVQTIVVSDDLRVDIAPDGTVYGIELLDARNQLADGTLEIVNQATGHASRVRLAG